MNTADRSVWRSECERYTVIIESACLSEMVHLAREHGPNEVGTALVGSYSDDGFTARICRLAPLTQDSRGGARTFFRGVRGLRDFFLKIFTSSRGRMHYVGEWHSHPGGAAVPSFTDDENALSIARDPRSDCPECVLIILAFSRADVELGVYVYSSSQGRVMLGSCSSPPS